jgi:hypothetical protein
MANVIRCDHCQKEEIVRNIMATTPPGWIELIEQQPGSTPNEHHQVCSRSCGAALLSKPRNVERTDYIDPDPELVN